MIIRKLARDEVERVWSIDRSEVVDQVYYLQDGELVLEPEHWDMRDWPPGERERYTPILRDCFDRGGTFYGAFEAGELVGVAVLESQFIGQQRDQLQLMFLHVSRVHRGRGVGTSLFEKATAKARAMGARKVYISATPSQNTIDFYLSRGCRVTSQVDPDLWALEPDDIHLEYRIPGGSEGGCVQDVPVASVGPVVPLKGWPR